jgi:pimeloyl-[acyl-carrier protein] methyl ester esterase
MNESRTLKLLFMPGIDGTGISFEPLRQFLPANIETTVIRYPAEKDLSFEETVDSACEQITQDPDVVLAESFSGPVAVVLIGLGLLNARGLILSATFARTPRPFLMKILSLLPVGSILKLPFPNSWLRYFIGDAKAAGVILPLWERIRREVPARILAHRIRIVGRIDVREYLSKIMIPCLYIQAAGDRIVPASSVLDFAGSVRDLQIKQIDGPHPILQVEPEASAAIIINFIEALALKGGTRW